MANKIDGEDIYQIGINELAEKSSVDVTDVVAIQQSSGGVVQKKSVGAIVEKAQAQADWNEADNTKADFIKNKPTIPAAQIQSDWNQGDNTKLDFIKNKPTIPSVGNREIEIQKNGTKVDSFTTNESGSTKKTINITVPTTAADVHALPDSTVIPDAQIQSDWNQSDNTKKDYIKNKPTIPAAQIQSDWSQADNTKLDFIKNKPSIPTVNNSTITITQGGVPKGSFDLNQSSAQTIALDAGGGASVINVYGLCNNNFTPYDGGSAFVSGYRVFNIDDYCVYEYDGSDFIQDTSVVVSDGQLVYSAMENAFYAYSSNMGLLRLSKGKIVYDIYYNDGSYHCDCYVPKCDTLTRLNVANVSTGFDLTIMNMVESDVNDFSAQFESCHTILLYNTVNSDLSVTVSAAGYDSGSSTSGVYYSGLDSNRSFTLKANGYAELSVVYGKYPSVIVKSDFDAQII